MNYIEVKKCTKNSGIYCITNNINNKVYIGQAIKLRKRLLVHVNYKEDSTPLYKAFSKYGIENFEFTILEEFEGKDYNEIKKKLDELEIYYINKYDSYNKGYNQTLGGDGGILGYKMTDEQKRKISENANPYKNPCIAYNIITKNILTFNSQTECSNFFNIESSSINRRCYNEIYSPIQGYLIMNCIEELEGKLIIPLKKEYSEENFKDILNSNTFTSKKDIENIFGICEKTFYNYLKKWNLKSPLNTKLKIAFYVIEDIINNKSYKMNLQQMNIFFGNKDCRKFPDRYSDNLYKNQFHIYKYYDYPYNMIHSDEDGNKHCFRHIKGNEIISIYGNIYSLYYILDNIEGYTKIY